jgi:hypothetical protein
MKPHGANESINARSSNQVVGTVYLDHRGIRISSVFVCETEVLLYKAPR